jgi:hypothetical protein
MLAVRMLAMRSPGAFLVTPLPADIIRTTNTRDYCRYTPAEPKRCRIS